MTERRKTCVSAHMRVNYPVFEDENAPAFAEEMNAFYSALTEAVIAYAQEIAKRGGGIRILTADYQTIVQERRITVEYKLSIRHRGKTEAVKTITHIWENGVLVSTGKIKKRFFMPLLKMRKLLTARTE